MIPDPSDARNLDPEDWDRFASHAHRALDRMIEHIRTVRERPLWQHARPQDFDGDLPADGSALDDVIDSALDRIVPLGPGNLHPAFMGWVHGAGTPAGMVAEMIAAGMNANCGGRDHSGLEVERQIVRWMARLFGFPAESSGLFVTGTSTANLIAVVIARQAALGSEVRSLGMAAARQALIGYASEAAHSSIARAFEIVGIGRAALRSVPTKAGGEIDCEALAAMIAADRGEGSHPFMLIGTAGTAATGAIDDLKALAAIGEAERLWYHVDGAIGALGVLAPSLRCKLAGLESADSIALDFHKWLHVPYDAGFLICRHPELHRQSFSTRPSYLGRAPRGLAAGDDWPCDFGPDLSRGFRALKVWLAFQHFGTERLGASIEQGCALARHLAGLVGRSPHFELRAPVALNIVCFGLKGGTGEIEREIVMDLQERGLAVPSTVELDGKSVIRCAIMNHRTTRDDLEDFIGHAEQLAADHLSRN